MDFQSEVTTLFEKLNLWREESQKEFSNIINYHSDSMNKGINDLIEQLAAVTKERNELIKKVDLLNCEVRKQNVNSKFIPLLLDFGRNATNDKQEMRKAGKHGMKRKSGEEFAGGGISDHMEEQDQLNDQVDLDDLNLDEDISGMEDGDHICPECNSTFSTNKDLKIHLINDHSKFKLAEENSEDNVEFTEQNYNLRISEVKSMPDTKISKGRKLQSGSGKRRKMLKCERCDYETSMRGCLSKHVQGVHKKVRSGRVGSANLVH